MARNKRQAVQYEAKKEFWLPHLKSWQCSGQTASAFCKAHELNIHQFRYWQTRLMPNIEAPTVAVSSSSLPAFIELKALPGGKPVSELLIEFGEGCKLKLPLSLSMTELSKFFRALRGVEC